MSYGDHRRGRKVSQAAWKACVDCRRFTCKNTTANAHGVQLFETTVVERLTDPQGPREEARFRLRTGGWNTPTTRDRLRPFVINVWTERKVMYINGIPWDGESLLVVDYHGAIVEVEA